MPTVTSSCISDVSLPRISFGASSDRYIGTTTEAMPTPTPITNRNPTNSAAVPDSAAPRVPSVKTAPAPRINLRRPRESASLPARPAPNMAPASRPETTMPCTIGLSWMSFLMYSIAPEMTPVS
jgi:hypothetical protein